MDERLGRLQVVGLLLGFLGVALVVSNRLTTEGLSPLTLGLTTMALLAITAGTLYQKRFCPEFDLRTGPGRAVRRRRFVVTLPFALAFESFRFDWTPQLVGALAWSVLVLTGGGISLLFLMLRRGAAAQVTSYFYLVPGITALMAWLMFGETLERGRGHRDGGRGARCGARDPALLTTIWERRATLTSRAAPFPGQRPSDRGGAMIAEAMYFLAAACGGTGGALFGVKVVDALRDACDRRRRDRKAPTRSASDRGSAAPAQPDGERAEHRPDDHRPRAAAARRASRRVRPATRTSSGSVTSYSTAMRSPAASPRG